MNKLPTIPPRLLTGPILTITTRRRAWWPWVVLALVILLAALVRVRMLDGYYSYGPTVPNWKPIWTTRPAWEWVWLSIRDFEIVIP